MGHSSDDTREIRVREKIVEVAKVVKQEKIVEVPEIHYIDKVVEVPQIQYVDRLHHHDQPPSRTGSPVHGKPVEISEYRGHNHHHGSRPQGQEHHHGRSGSQGLKYQHEKSRSRDMEHHHEGSRPQGQEHHYGRSGSQGLKHQHQKSRSRDMEHHHEGSRPQGHQHHHGRSRSQGPKHQHEKSRSQELKHQRERGRPKGQEHYETHGSRGHPQFERSGSRRKEYSQPTAGSRRHEHQPLRMASVEYVSRTRGIQPPYPHDQRQTYTSKHYSSYNPVRRDVHRTIPVPVEAVVGCEFEIASIKPKYKRKEIPLYAPRFVEVPIPAELMDPQTCKVALHQREQVHVLAAQTAPSLAEVEKIAEFAKNMSFETDITKRSYHNAIQEAWKQNRLTVRK